MQKIKLIKTLPHLHPLFLQSGANLYANSFSENILESINSAKLIKDSQLTFSNLINLLNNSKSKKKIDSAEAGDIGRIGDILEYTKVDIVTQELEFSVKGDVILAWLAGYTEPIKFEFFGEDLENLNFYDLNTGKSGKKIENLIWINILPQDKGELSEISIDTNNSFNEFNKIIFTNKVISNSIKDYFNNISIEIYNTDFIFSQLFFSKLDLLLKEIKRLKANNYDVLIKTSHTKDLLSELKKYLISKSNFESIKSKTIKEFNYEEILKLPAGFETRIEKFVLFTDRELFGTIDLKSNKNKLTDSNKLKKILRQFEGEIEINSYVVHEDYGVAKYVGLEQQEVDGIKNDYLLLEFAEKDELYVPISQITKISKYLGLEAGEPKLTRLGKGAWQALKNKVRKTTLITAKELVNHYAKIELSKAIKVDDKDSELYKNFVEKFEYSETPDQQKAINEVIKDLESIKPMNRLLVGDVGFGKTEVMLRAAFKIIESGAQVAVLCPTTVLASQHYDVFTERFSKLKSKFKIGIVSRFNTSKQNREVIDKVNNAEIDILIGTHRLLSSDVKFKKLGLLIVDEEQRFGVRQKEKIKKLNYGTHVLNVSATPIPRSLSLALSSIQDISLITQAPPGRKPVETEIIEENWEKAANSIQKEISRGGQVYFVHNRITSIEGIANKIKELVPNIQIQVAHGRMRADKLDEVITDFYKHKFDLLLSTSIIENGLDIPNVNTIIIHDAHKFGLSQLYQMRGRVGRSEKKAFCYLMCPSKSEVSDLDSKELHQNQQVIRTLIKSNKKLKTRRDKYLERLETLVNNQDLGAGFKIASKDLEIRGAGSVLGEKQSGHINKVGYAMYIEMLADAIEKLDTN